MKHLLLMSALLLSINAFAKPSITDSDKGNGGSGSETLMVSSQVMIEDVAIKIKHFFIKNETKLSIIFPEFKVIDLVRKINETELEIVNNEFLIDKHDIKRTCLNFPNQAKINCSASLIEKISSNPQALFVLVLHEYLGLIGVEETSPKNAQMIDGYSISKRIAPYISKLSQYDLVFKSIDLLDILTNPGMVGIDRTLDDRDKKTFILNGFTTDNSIYDEDEDECSIRIVINNGKTIDIVDHRMDAILGRDNTGYPITAYKNHMNNSYNRLTMKKDDSKVKAQIKNGILTFQQTIYDPTFMKGIIPLYKSRECAVNLSQIAR